MPDRQHLSMSDGTSLMALADALDSIKKHDPGYPPFSEYQQGLSVEARPIADCIFSHDSRRCPCPRLVRQRAQAIIELVRE